VACGEAGGRASVREGHRTKPNRTERHAGAAAQAACISRAGRRAKAGRLGRLLELLRWQAVSELGDEPARRPSTPPPAGTAEAGRVAGQLGPCTSVTFLPAGAVVSIGFAHSLERAIEMWFVYCNICTWRHVELQSL